MYFNLMKEENCSRKARRRLQLELRLSGATPVELFGRVPDIGETREHRRSEPPGRPLFTSLIISRLSLP